MMSSPNIHILVDDGTSPRHAVPTQKQQLLKSKTTNTMAQKIEKQVQVIDFFNPNKPWVLGQKEVKTSGDFEEYIPDSYRFGPWRPETNLTLGVVLCLLSMGGVWMLKNSPSDDASWMSLFEADQESYTPFTVAWCYNSAAFFWMLYVCYNVAFLSPIGPGAWISFTLWGWTALTLRHGMLVAAPWVPFLRVPAEVLRFPSLLAASVITGFWNLVVHPMITMYYIKDAEQAEMFTKAVTDFRFTQLHLFNFIYATISCVYMQPTRPLHLGDLAAAAIMFTCYMFMYLCILDRLAVHIYPMFSPRSPFASLGLILLVFCTVGGYLFWGQFFPSLA
eukprot:Nitzschia sp. Nitz4//scaffold25_size161228//125641//126642//NITZ4_002451-RA/size161228-processed-gene-0.196-mRNA-1//-1//CDS//3329544649//5759//frame0